MLAKLLIAIAVLMCLRNAGRSQIQPIARVAIDDPTDPPLYTLAALRGTLQCARNADGVYRYTTDTQPMRLVAS